MRFSSRSHLTASVLLTALAILTSADSSFCRNPAFELSAHSENRAVVTFRIPSWNLEPADIGDGYLRIVAPGGETVPQQGYPELPAYKALVAVPPGSRLSVNSNVLSSRTVRCGNLLPAQLVADRDLPPRTNYAVEILETGGVNPVPVETHGPSRLRDYEIAELIIRPFSWDMRTGTLRVTELLEVSLDFATSTTSPTSGFPAARENLYEPFYQNLLLNYEQASAWRVPRAGGGSRLAAAGPFDNGGQWLQIRIDSSGMYALTGQQLQQAGVNLSSLDPSTVSLYTGGNRMLDPEAVGETPALEEVAIALTGTGAFSATDSIIFYGMGTDRFAGSTSSGIYHIRHRYENHATYWLNIGADGGGQRIESVQGPATGTPSTTAERWFHFEGNTAYMGLEQQGGNVVNPAPDQWGWVLDTDRSGIISRSFSLPAAPSGSNNLLRFEFYGRGPEFASAWSAGLNGSTRASGNNPSAVAYTSEWIELPAGLLMESLNSFALSASGQYLGWFEIRAELPLNLGGNSQLAFHRTRQASNPSFLITSGEQSAPLLYEVTDPENPSLITPGAGDAFYPPIAASTARSFVAVAGNGYRSPLDITPFQPPSLAASNGAEYLVVAPRTLTEQAVELAGMRQDRYSTDVAVVEDIYAEYALGPADPVAIRNFLYDTYTNWPVRPQLVVFLGDGHVDYRGVTSVGATRPNLLPPWVDNRDIAVEEWFTRFDTTGLPQIATGRIPVANTAEASLVLDKIAAYEESRDAGEWSRRVVLVADDGYVTGRNCDNVRNHVPGSEFIDSLLPDGLVRRKIYLDAYPFDPPEIGTVKPEANQDLINWWNRGALLINYLGHGSNLHWAQERVFDSESDVGLLNNGYRLPLVLNSSCSIGHFDDYRTEAMAERILLKSGGGAIAVFAGTRVTFAIQNQVLNQRFIQHLFGEERLPLGMIHFLSRHELAAGDRGNAERYSIFGDPALFLHRPVRDISVSPEPGSDLAPGEKVEFSGTVALPGGGVDGNFSGVAQVKFMLTGQPVDITYQCGGNVTRGVSFERTPSVLFDGPVTVAGGSFSGAFVLPVRLAGEIPADSLAGATGLFSAYATSEAADAAGAGTPQALPLADGTSSDTSAPVIRLLSGGRELSDGERVSRDEPLVLVVNDQSGINTTGRPGEQLTVEVDGGMTWSADLTGLFSYDRDSYQQGTAAVALNRVPEGLHSFRFRAVDNALNSSRLELMLNISESAGGLVLSEVVNYPNPFSEMTSICFEVNQPADVLIRIFTVAGRPVKELRTFAPTAGFHTVDWHGTDEYQQKVANGVYLYKITCRSSADISPSEEVEAVGKALLSR